MIALAVTYLVKPGHEEDVAAILNILAPLSRAEPGCLMYVAHRSPTDPRKFFLYEQYRDQAALDEHRASPHFLEHAKGKMFDLLETRTPEIYHPLD